jgi:hypothetical protein
LNFLEIQERHAQELETAEYIQVEQRVRVVQAAATARPPRLLPAMHGANHHLRGMDQVVMQIVNLTWFESLSPIRLFQLASERRLACKEAILEMTRQKSLVLRVLSLRGQEALYVFNDFFATR